VTNPCNGVVLHPGNAPALAANTQWTEHGATLTLMSTGLYYEATHDGSCLHLNPGYLYIELDNVGCDVTRIEAAIDHSILPSAAQLYARSTHHMAGAHNTTTGAETLVVTIDEAIVHTDLTTHGSFSACNVTLY
jgi:hypothetical protein